MNFRFVCRGLRALRQLVVVQVMFGSISAQPYRIRHLVWWKLQIRFKIILHGLGGGTGECFKKLTSTRWPKAFPKCAPWIFFIIESPFNKVVLSFASINFVSALVLDCTGTVSLLQVHTYFITIHYDEFFQNSWTKSSFRLFCCVFT